MMTECVRYDQKRSYFNKIRAIRKLNRNECECEFKVFEIRNTKRIARRALP